jgi:hypothetical protein
LLLSDTQLSAIGEHKTTRDKLHQGIITGLAFVPTLQTGKTYALASSSEDTTVRILSFKKSHSLTRQTLCYHKGKVNGVNFSADGRYMISCGVDGEIFAYRIVRDKGHLDEHAVVLADDDDAEDPMVQSLDSSSSSSSSSSLSSLSSSLPASPAIKFSNIYSFYYGQPCYCCEFYSAVMQFQHSGRNAADTVDMRYAIAVGTEDAVILLRLVDAKIQISGKESWDTLLQITKTTEESSVTVDPSTATSVPGQYIINRSHNFTSMTLTHRERMPAPVLTLSTSETRVEKDAAHKLHSGADTHLDRLPDTTKSGFVAVKGTWSIFTWTDKSTYWLEINKASNQLLFFSSPTSMKPDMTVALTSIEKCVAVKTNPQKPVFRFKVKTNEKTMYIDVTSRPMLRDWVTAIRQAVRRSNAQDLIVSVGCADRVWCVKYQFMNVYSQVSLEFNKFKVMCDKQVVGQCLDTITTVSMPPVLVLKDLIFTRQSVRPNYFLLFVGSVDMTLSLFNFVIAELTEEAALQMKKAAATPTEDNPNPAPVDEDAPLVNAMISAVPQPLLTLQRVMTAHQNSNFLSIKTREKQLEPPPEQVLPAPVIVGEIREINVGLLRLRIAKEVDDSKNKSSGVIGSGADDSDAEDATDDEKAEDASKTKASGDKNGNNKNKKKVDKDIENYAFKVLGNRLESSKITTDVELVDEDHENDLQIQISADEDSDNNHDDGEDGEDGKDNEADQGKQTDNASSKSKRVVKKGFNKGKLKTFLRTVNNVNIVD